MKVSPAMEAKILTLAGVTPGGPGGPYGGHSPTAVRTKPPEKHAGPAGWAVEFVIPWRPVNESNIGGGLGAKIARKGVAKRATLAALPPVLPPVPVRVTFTRLGGTRQMDGDGFQNAMKAVRDIIAGALGVDDGDRENVSWRYRQRAAYGACRVLVRVAAG